MSTIQEVHSFIENYAVEEHIPAMEEMLARAIGYRQYIGSLCNQAEVDYRKAVLDAVNRLGTLEQETETLRKTKLDAWTAEKKQTWQNLKLMAQSLKQIEMSLYVAMKNRRDNP